MAKTFLSMLFNNSGSNWQGCCISHIKKKPVHYYCSHEQ